MSKTKEQILSDLDANIPKSAVEQRQGGGASKLSYLAGWYVIDRMNKIFGPDAWSYDVTELRCVHQGELDGKYGKIFSASYSATVALFVSFQPGDQAKRITDVGFGNGTDKTDPGKPHELATKEAVTDALKRCAKSLGMSLGLALYDKKQENVGDEEPAPKSSLPALNAAYKASKAPQAPVDAPALMAALAPKPAPTKTVAPKDALAVAVANAVAPTFAAYEKTVVSDREALNKRITAMSSVILAKAGPVGSEPRKAKLTELKADMKSKYGADSTAGLDDAEAKDLLTNLEKLANGN